MYLALLACPLLAWGLDNTADDASLWTPLIPVISPLYLEKSVNPLSLGQENGWQLGGINSQFDVKNDDSVLSLRGGLFYSRRTGPRQILDNTPLPDNRFGQQFNDGQGSRAFGLPQGLLFSGNGQQTTDQIAYQRVNYQGHGLSLSGSYAEVGKDFQGLGELVKQMVPGDPEGAKLLGQGVTRTNFNVGYTGIQGLSLQNTLSREQFEAAGDKNGLTKTVRNNSLAYNLSDRQKLEFSQSQQTEEWDPTVVKKDGKDVTATTLRFTRQLGGNKSLLSFSRVDTETVVGQKETDQQQEQYSLAWNEWRNLQFNGGFTRQMTEQTGEERKTINLDLVTTLFNNVKITGKLLDGEILRPDASPVQNDLLDLKVVAQLLPTVQISSLYQDIDTPEKGQITTSDHTLSWLITPQWKLTTRLLDIDNAKTGSTDRTEYSLVGQIGTPTRAEQLGLSLRTDVLPNDVQQTRREISYTRPLGTKEVPVALRVQLGQYALEQSQAVVKDDTLLTVQLLTLRPLPNTVISFGHYDGPTLGANYLAYRSWGQKPQGNLETWNDSNFVQYRESGTELVYSLTGSTKVVLKQLFGEREDTGRVDTSEYGIEQQFGQVKLLAGQRMTAQTGSNPDLRENWWQLNWAGAKPLPDWAVKSTRQTVFADSGAWGLAALPVWVKAPTSGLMLERRDELVGGKPVDATTLRYATMLGRLLYLQASYERDPRKADKPAEVEPLEREIVHLGYQLRPTLLTYARFMQENRRDAVPSLLTNSFGIIGTLSNAQKLHMQIELMERTNGTVASYGTAYMFGYERTLNQEDTLVVKYRYLPAEFSTPENRIRLEASYQRAF